MEIKWLRKALKNLDQEAEYIAKDDTQTARLVVKRSNQTISLLSENPSLRHPGRLPGTHGTRHSQNTLYRVRPRLQQIEILRLFHPCRKLPERWLPGRLG